MITRKHIDRRMFLRGAGAAIALPLLDSMTPAFAAPTAASKAPTRLAFSYVPNGVTLKEWTPAQTGQNFQFSRILKPLEPFRQHTLVLSGLDHANANELGDGGGDHARAGACFLTGVHPKKTAGSDIKAGISVDQIAAQSLGSASRLPSIELGCEDSRTVGNCDSGYSCAYTNSISWRGPASPMPPETNPRLVFERLFGTTDFNLDPNTRARRGRYRKSILDMVTDRTKQLLGDLGPADRRKVDEYLYAIREVERRIERAENDNQQFVPSIDKPSGIPIVFSDHIKLMYDLQVLAFQADVTRIATMAIGREGSVRTFNEIGISDPHHPLSHHRNNPEWIEKLTRINTFHMEQFAYFVGKLKATPDGDGTLLDHSALVYGSAISDGNKHTHENLPLVMAGGANGLVRPGRHVVYAKGTPMTNLYVALLDGMGVKTESIGDSNGKLNYLTDL